MSRTFCLARSVDVLEGVPTKRWQRFMRGLLAGKSRGCWRADIKNFFGNLNHEWMLRFVDHRVGDQRLISLIRRWLKAGVLENGEIHPSEEGTPQGGSVSVLLSNVYLHYVLDLWFERVVSHGYVVKPAWCDMSTTSCCVFNIARMLPEREEHLPRG